MAAEPSVLDRLINVASIADARRGHRVIELRAGELARVVAEAEAALIEAGAEIYQRGGQLVRVVALDAPLTQHGIRRAAGARVILPVTREWLALELARHVTFLRFDARAKKLLPIDPPPKIAAAILSAAGEWHFEHLAGIVTAPTLRRDGTLLDRSGFDSESCLYAAFDAEQFPVIDPRPSRQAAEASLQQLRDVFAESAFSGGADSAHASVVLAAVITACLRSALEMAPASGISAHKAGSGKTTVGKVIAQVAIGTDPPVFSPTEDEQELAKALLAILIAGDPILLLDNISRPLDSAALCAVLTSATYRGRVLGLSQTVTVPTRATWIVTGNSLEFVGDLTSRALLCVLDPQVEHPERRPFKRDLAAYVLANRGALVRAALTVPLAYIAAGSPAVDRERSRFSDWDRLVRYPLLWLGAADPLATQDELRGADPVRETLLAVLHAWRDTFGSDPVTVARAVDAASGAGMSANSVLQEALHAAAGERNGEINGRRLGRYLVRSLRRIEDGLRLEDAGQDPITCRRKFRVTSVSSVSANPSRASGSENKSVGAETDADNAGNAECLKCSGEGCKWCSP